MTFWDIVMAAGGGIVFLLGGAFGRDLFKLIRDAVRERRKAKAARETLEAKQQASEREDTTKIKLAEADAHRSADRFLRDLVKEYGERVDMLMGRLDAQTVRIDGLQDEIAECEKARAADVARAERLEAEVKRLEAEVMRLRSEMRTR